MSLSCRTGPGITGTLHSYDVKMLYSPSWQRLRRIPGYGFCLVLTLLADEARFTKDTQKTVTGAEVNAVRQSCTIMYSLVVQIRSGSMRTYPPVFFDLGPAGRSPWPSGGFWENHQTMGDFPAMFSARVDGMINQLGIKLLEEVIADVLFSFYCYSTLYICSSSGSMYDVDHCLVLLFELS